MYISYSYLTAEEKSIFYSTFILIYINSLHNNFATPFLKKCQGHNIIVTKLSSTMCQIHFLTNFCFALIQKLNHNVTINLKWNIIYPVYKRTTVTTLCTQVDGIFLSSVHLIWTFWHTTSIMKRCRNEHLKCQVCRPWQRKQEYWQHSHRDSTPQISDILPSSIKKSTFNILCNLNIHKSFTDSRHVRFKIFVVVSIHITVFCDVMPWNFVDVTYVSEEPAASIFRIKDRSGRFNWNITTIYPITWHSILKDKYLNSRFQDLSLPDPVIDIITCSTLATIK